MSRSRFGKLLEKTRIGNVELRNRMVKAAYATFVTDNQGGRIAGVGDSMKGHIECIAKGGIGMIITESCAIDYPLGLSGRYRFHITSDDFIIELSELPKITHKFGTPIFLQLHHAGPSFSAKGRYGAVSDESIQRGESRLTEAEDCGDLRPVAASSLDVDELPIALQSPPRGLSVREIRHIVEKFSKGAQRARKAGFDGVELHFAHGYLLNSFLSLAWNKRTDDYGCSSLENRARFGVEVIEAIKNKCGDDFPIGVRINGREWGSEKVIRSEESQGFARIFEAAGASYIHVTGYGYGFGSHMFWMFPDQALYPEPPRHLKRLARRVRKSGAMVPYAAAIKRVVSIPVIVVDGLSPALGEWALRKRKADLIAFARPLIADPELPNKVASGRSEEIAPCTSCMTCISEVMMGNPIRCRINAALGKEWEYPTPGVRRRKKLLILGGGPAGMEAARVAANRGHDVRLYERSKRVGGLLRLAALVKGAESEDLLSIIRYLKHEMRRLGVRIITGREIDKDLIEKERPDVIVIAAGGEPSGMSKRTGDAQNVLTSRALQDKVRPYLDLLGPRVLGGITKFWLPIGTRVAIVGGLIQGCEIAEYLVKRGRNVTVIEEGEQLGAGLPEVKRLRLTSWLQEKGVCMFTGVRDVKISRGNLTFVTEKGESTALHADHIILAGPVSPNQSIKERLKSLASEIYMAGDSRNPGLIVDAIADGFQIGNSI